MSVVAGTASTPGRHRERLAGILARGPARPVRRACSRIVGSRHAIAGVDSERRWLGDGAAAGGGQLAGHEQPGHPALAGGDQRHAGHPGRQHRPQRRVLPGKRRAVTQPSPL